MEASDLPPRVRLALGTGAVVYESRVFCGHDVGEPQGEGMSASQLHPFLPPTELLKLFFYSPYGCKSCHRTPTEIRSAAPAATLCSHCGLIFIVSWYCFWL